MRLAVVQKEKCSPVKCDSLCARLCPVNRKGEECIKISRCAFHRRPSQSDWARLRRVGTTQRRDPLGMFHHAGARPSRRGPASLQGGAGRKSAERGFHQNLDCRRVASSCHVRATGPAAAEGLGAEPMESVLGQRRGHPPRNPLCRGESTERRKAITAMGVCNEV